MARYPDVGENMAFDENGRRYVGSYVRENGQWRRANWNDLGPRLAWVLEQEYAAMLRPHPLVEWYQKRQHVA